MIEILESQNVLRRNRFSLISQMKFSELPVSHGGPESAAYGAPTASASQNLPRQIPFEFHDGLPLKDMTELLKIKNFLVCDAACLIMTTGF